MKKWEYFLYFKISFFISQDFSFLWFSFNQSEQQQCEAGYKEFYLEKKKILILFWFINEYFIIFYKHGNKI